MALLDVIFPEKKAELSVIVAAGFVVICTLITTGSGCSSSLQLHMKNERMQMMTDLKKIAFMYFKI